VQTSYLLTVLAFLPVAGTLALLLLRDDDHVWIRRLAMTAATVEFALSLMLLRGFDMHSTGYQWEEYRAWIPQPPIHYHLGVDGLSLFLVLLTTLLTPISILASWKSIDQRVKGFFISLLVLETGVIGVFVSCSSSFCSGK
jgi:NADH-quinone oxidoreductase subunit M